MKTITIVNAIRFGGVVDYFLKYLENNAHGNMPDNAKEKKKRNEYMVFLYFKNDCTKTCMGNC